MFSLFKTKLTQKEEYCLRNHKYRCIDRSILSAYIFKRYTSFVLNNTPETISPNMLTLFGYIIMLFNFITVILYDVELCCKESWISLFSAMCLFFYFTMDNLDGAQARKLKEMSPLGQLFDHGVDSCVVFFCMITLISSLRLGLSLTSLLVILTVMYGFYFSGLEEKFTGLFEFGFISGPTEGIMFIIILHLMSAFRDTSLSYTVDCFTHHSSLTRVITFVPVSPLFLLSLSVFIYNYISSYFKSLKLTKIKKRREVFFSYFSIGLLIPPLYTLHSRFLLRPDLQIINLIIFAQNFSLKYIEEVYCNIIGGRAHFYNFSYILYVLFAISAYFFESASNGFVLVCLFFITLCYYLNSIYNAIFACKTSLKINILSLNKKN
ncbi:hypothetical protein NCER_101291 [Vairimorpha ceranae BRL01]|uniref:Cdp-alcohol phosphatidyltransferase n=1 Tax=Vairimorpha ceranae (strain BRL01) TaxID=578460 RepID=C4V9N8_VAIC1|nr:hypothetical protein NCER_101291 [Vairimorpha ceranae BRL01]